MCRAQRKLNLPEFLGSKESNERYELADGELVPKVSPNYFRASVQGRFLQLIDDWCQQQQYGRVLPEWAIVLQRQGKDWVPVPDLTYISYQRLPLDWEEDAPCPIPPELVIEIISPGQSFGEMTQKATDYLRSGVSRVWVADNQAQSITAFGADEFPQTFWINNTIWDPLLPELRIAIADLFAKRGRSPNAER